MSQRKEDKQTAFSVKPWKRLWRCVRQHRVRFAVAIISNLLMAATDFYIPLMQSEVVDAFITKQASFMSRPLYISIPMHALK